MAVAKQPIELKGGTVTLMSLHLHNEAPAAVGEALREKIDQAPNFFGGAPVVLDFEALDGLDGAGMEALIDTVKDSQVVPIAARGAPERLHPRLKELGLPPLRTEARALDTAPKQAPEAQEPARPAAPLVERRPLRSGQQLYAPGGDLVLMATTSAGSELIADGSIHVYGALRGRALCGVSGLEGACIFCDSLEAELVSIAGNYKLLEEIPTELRGRRVHIWLDGQKLNIEPF